VEHFSDSSRWLSRRGVLGSSAMALAAAAGYRPPADRDPAAVVNVRASVDRFVAHIEPAIAADSCDPRKLLIASRIFQDGKIGMASYSSHDGGAHWTSAGLLPGLTPDFDGNPAVAFDRTGTGYICGIAATTDLPRRGDALLWPRPGKPAVAGQLPGTDGHTRRFPSRVDRHPHRNRSAVHRHCRPLLVRSYRSPGVVRAAGVPAARPVDGLIRRP
jgi:hypothetical protein